MNILTIVGARPQFIKASPVSRVLRKQHKEYLVHTGQHYDENMSRLFFEELGIPEPDVNLEIGSGLHAQQTGKMMIDLEKLLLDKKPDLVMVYGDTNSTLVGALSAAKLNIPVAHVEAGLRSYNRKMPEEINRVLTDHMSTLLFCPTKTAIKNLKLEGITKGVYLTGDVMLDASLLGLKVAERKSNILSKFNIKPKKYYLATVHRASNADNIKNLGSILKAFACLELPVIFPVHPRTHKKLKYLKKSQKDSCYKNIRFVKPLSYLDMLKLEKNALKILTDSGGVQKEAYFLKVPCVSLRDETEWVETLNHGWNILAAANYSEICKAVRVKKFGKRFPALFGNGNASVAISKIIGNYKSG